MRSAINGDGGRGLVINVSYRRRRVAEDGGLCAIGVGVGRLKRDREADVLLSEGVRGASCNGFVISDPGVGDGANAVWISE